MQPITIQTYGTITVVRDDLLPGGTKSILMPFLVGDAQECVYASPVFGGFQIALSAYMQKLGRKATIVCAKRKERHPNTMKCLELGANVIELATGYLTVLEKRAREYAEKEGALKLEFGAHSPECIKIIAERVSSVFRLMQGYPDEIWCAVGSGTLIESIAEAIPKENTKTHIMGVVIGKRYTTYNPRIGTFYYPKPFETASKYPVPFPSMPNYDLKAWEICSIHQKMKPDKNLLFWNVL